MSNHDPTLVAYSSEQLADMTIILRQGKSGIEISQDELHQQLLDLLHAVGIDDGSDYAAMFREAGAGQPTYAELAVAFDAVAKADDPLDPKICSGVVLTELNYAARGVWGRRIRERRVNRPDPLRGVSSDMLSDEELTDVREIGARYASYYRSFVRRGAPRKTDQDTLLNGLADIFLEFTRLACHRYDLPHAENSYFMQFTYEALRPVFGMTEATRKGLSRRWERLKRHHRTGTP